MVDVSSEGAVLTVDGEEVTFDYDIGDVIVLDDVAVVLLDNPPGEIDNRNVVAVDDAGNIVWRIPRSPKTSFEDDPYMSIYLKEGELWARCWGEWAYKLDPKTGEILDGHATR